MSRTYPVYPLLLVAAAAAALVAGLTALPTNGAPVFDRLALVKRPPLAPTPEPEPPKPPHPLADPLEEARVQQAVSNLLAQFDRRPDVLLANRSTVQQKLTAFIRGGPTALAVISDWDRTITKGSSLSSHSVVDKMESLTVPCRGTMTRNTAKYLPIEQDPALTTAEKLPHMRDWYRLNHQAFVACGVKKTALAATVRATLHSGSLAIRDGAVDAMQQAAAMDLPFLIFSAGLADVIEVALSEARGAHDVPTPMPTPTPASTVRAAALAVPPACTAAATASVEASAARNQTVPCRNDATATTTSLNIVSNTMQWSGDELVGFSDPLIHMFNKDQSQVPVAEQPGTHARTHIILLGDGLGDATMADGAAQPPTHVLRVGFLNYDDPHAHVAGYLQAFDVVLLGDGSMGPVNSILAAVAAADRTRVNVQ